MSSSRSCPSLLISAPASNHGKTTVTAGIARRHRQQGRNVRAFKIGPDFLDPMILERASGNTVYQLDLWMMGEDHCRRLLYDAAADADVILVEGVMGLFDGTPSSADLADLFRIPIAVVIDVQGMAQSFHAVAHGLRTFRKGLRFHGAIANGVAGSRHAEMLSENIPIGVRYLGGLARDVSFVFPARHLGLTQANEIADIDTRIDAAARAVARCEALAALPPSVDFFAPVPIHGHGGAMPLRGTRIAIAQDEAFSFIYRANIDLLQEAGADISCFSPLRDRLLPACDVIYLPGGYPELHLDGLSENTAMKESIRGHAHNGGVVYAECGGMLYLLETLNDQFGAAGKMVGLLPGNATVGTRMQSLGYQVVDTEHGPVRGHTFHYSSIDSPLNPSSYAIRRQDGNPGEAVYRSGNVRAAYVHLYFPSNPVAAIRLLRGEAVTARPAVPIEVPTSTRQD